METLTRKQDVKNELNACLRQFQSKGVDRFVSELNERLLKVKVKFPLLKYCGLEIFEKIPENDHIPICDRIESLKTIGGNVIIAIILQSRLSPHFEESFDKAALYISYSDEWHPSDIIGERVFGFSLLQNPDQTIPVLKKLMNHESSWVVRSVGAGCHYAIKKGLAKENVKQVFLMLLSLGNASDYHVKTGIGWAAKTTAKFHPDLVLEYQTIWKNRDEAGQWFQSKVEKGLKRSEYAKRD